MTREELLNHLESGHNSDDFVLSLYDKLTKNKSQDQETKDLIDYLRKRAVDAEAKELAVYCKLDAAQTWNKCLEAGFANDIARVNRAMLRAMDERDELAKQIEKLKAEHKKEIDKLNKENNKLITKLKAINPQ